MNHLEGLDEHVREISRIANAPIKVEKSDQFARYHYDPQYNDFGTGIVGTSTYSSSWGVTDGSAESKERHSRRAVQPAPSSVKHLMVDPGGERVPCVSHYGFEFVPIDRVAADPLQKKYHRRSNPITKFGEALSLQASTMR